MSIASTIEFESAVEAAFFALRDESACPDVEFIGIDHDGEPEYDIDYEPMLACARRAIAAAGLGDDVDVEAASLEAIEREKSLSRDLDWGAFHEEMHKPDYQAAHVAYHRPNPYRRPTRIPVIAPSITSIVWRMTGRAPRLATNTRSRGSRRCSASRGDPDDPEPPRHGPGRHLHLGADRLLQGGRS